MKDSRYDYVSKRLSALRELRRPWEPIWDKCTEMCAADGKIYTFNAAGKVQQNLFDSTAANALKTFSASMKSLICPTNSQYHRLKPKNPKLTGNDTVRRYVEYVNDLCFKVRYAAGSGFSQESDLLFNSLGIIGHRPWLVEDRPGRGILYRAIPVREVYIDTDSYNKVDTVYREFEMSALAALKDYKDKAPLRLKEIAAKEPDRKLHFLHAVEPRLDRKAQYTDSFNMPIAAYNIWLDEEELIYESGYRVMPYQVPRYLGRDETPYATSPAQIAFFDILTVNEMGKTFLRSGQLQANPALLTSLLNGAAKAGSPGAVIKDALTSDGKPKILPMQYGNNLSITLEMQEKYREIINEAFLKKLFISLQDLSRMSATEVLERKAERGILLAPQSERITSEWLYGNVMRELDILGSYGYLDDVPEELFYDGSIALEFESPAVHMQNAGKIMGLYKTIEAATSLAQVDPSVLDVVDYQQAIREIAQYQGAPSKIIRSQQFSAALGEQKAKAGQAQALLNAAPVLSQSMNNLDITGAGA